LPGAVLIILLPLTFGLSLGSFLLIQPDRLDDVSLSNGTKSTAKKIGIAKIRMVPELIVFAIVGS
jgi:hypothetical protein